MIRNTVAVYTRGNAWPYLGCAVIRPRKRHALSGTFLMAGTGYHSRIPNRLKNKWHRATCMASPGLDDATVAPMIPVSVVPMFAPRVRGNISSRVINPTAAIGVSVAVVMDEDWTMMVMPIPTSMLRYGLNPMTFFKTRAAPPLMMICRAYTMQNKHAHKPPKDQIVRNVPAPASVIFHSVRAMPPLRRRLSHNPFFILGHTAYVVLAASIPSVRTTVLEVLL
mmetsp:Transcript_5147/g.17170  ORF Transcript_5147/g.17170 Transcript_5147/m.17170 type:complete len:223 (-) Transcript_5147:1346-2014(-)